MESGTHLKKKWGLFRKAVWLVKLNMKKMGLFDIFNKKDIVSDDGLNLIYSKEKNSIVNEIEIQKYTQ